MRQPQRHTSAAPGAAPLSPVRRRLLRSILATSAASLLTGCGADGFGADLPAPDTRGRAAVLLPLTGPQSDLGQILREAASLGGTTVGADAEIEVLDAGATPESAVRAARAGIEAGAKMLIGPLFSDQARAVAGIAPRDVPVVALSNDDSLAEAGAFVYGVTPLHAARAVFGYAAAQGIGDIAVAVPPGPFGARAVEGARAVAAEIGLTLRPPVVAADGAALTAAFEGNPPGAVYLPSAGPELAGFARAAQAAGAQVLGSEQWSSLALSDRPELDGAWFAAPDPLRFAPFARALEERGGQPGIVAGLVFDGIEMARLLGRLDQQTRKGLLRDKGFNGVLGSYRFLEFGRALRGLAVLGIEDGSVGVLGTTGV